MEDIIVVGAVYADGTRFVGSQGGPLMDISAPGVLSPGIGLSCASGVRNSIARDPYSVGVSMAGGSVAGLAAYLMSVETDLQGEGAPKKTKARILQLAWLRGVGDPLTIWNGEESSYFC